MGNAAYSNFNVSPIWLMEQRGINPLWETGLLLDISHICTAGCVHSSIFTDKLWKLIFHFYYVKNKAWTKERAV